MEREQVSLSVAIEVSRGGHLTERLLKRALHEHKLKVASAVTDVRPNRPVVKIDRGEIQLSVAIEIGTD
jgi:molybdopterin-binding protein